MKLYNTDGTEFKITLPDNTKQDIIISDSSYRQSAIMAVSYVTVYFSSPVSLNIPLSIYCDYKGQRYTLRKEANVTENHSANYEYVITLTSESDVMNDWMIVDSENRTKFSITATPRTILELIVRNLNDRSSGWTIGSCITRSEIELSFNCNYIWDALKMLADKCETEFNTENKTVSLGKVEFNKTNAIAISYGNGVNPGTGRELNTGTDERKIGVVVVQGGTRNIYKAKYGSKTLLLPKSQSIYYDGSKFSDEAGYDSSSAKAYTTNADGTRVISSNGVTREGSFDGSEIYPSRICTISSVTEVDATNNFWDIIDNSIPEALDFSKCIIAGETMTIKFSTGELTSKEFDVKYSHVDRRFEIVPADIDGIIMPESAVYKPAVGDKFVVLNITLPDAYVCDNATKTGASWDMFRDAVRYLYEHEEDSFTYKIDLNSKWAKTNWAAIESRMILGGYVNYSSGFDPGKLIRITSIKEYINKPYEPTITLSNKVTSGGIGSTLGKVEAQEVLVEETKKNILQFSKRQWRDAKETMALLQKAVDGFTDGISPVTIQTMQALVGSENLQFKFVNQKGTDTVPASTVADAIVYDNTLKVLTFTSKWIQHMSLGISSISSSHKPSEYKYWLISDMNHAIDDKDAAIPFYLYVVASKTAETGYLELSSTPKTFSDTDSYYFLVGVLNSEYAGERSLVTFYGFTEILPGRITTDRMISPDGLQFWDFLNSSFVLDNGKTGADHVEFSFNKNGDGKAILIGSLTQITPEGTQVDVNPSITSFVYKRSTTEPDAPTGGSFLAPIPEGWSNSIPDGTDQVWESSRIFTVNGLTPQQSAWTKPKALTDTIDLQYMYSSVASNPSDPTKTPANWTSSPGTDTIWKAERIKKNNTWGDWNIYKIKGDTAVTVQITGDTIFKYAKNSSTPDKTAVTLTANVQGLSSTDYSWKYWNGSAWTNFGFYNQSCNINISWLGAGVSLKVRCYVNSGAQYDECTLYRLYDGSDTINVILTNESHTIACNNDGLAKSGELGTSGKAYTNILVYKGATPLTTSEWSYGTITKSDGVSINTDTKGIIYVTGMTVDSGYVDIPIVVNSVTYTKRFSLTKSYDGMPGQAGTSPITAILTNDSAAIPCDSSGNVLSYTSAYGYLKVYDGIVDKTSECTDFAVSGTNCEGTINSTTDKGRYDLTSLTADAGRLVVSCKYGTTYVSKIFSVSKAKAGVNGENAVIYSVEPDVYTLVKSTTNAFTPSSVNFTFYKITGSTKGSFTTGYYKRFYSTDGTTFTSLDATGTQSGSATITPSSTYKAVKCVLYSDSACTTVLDYQTVLIVSDGSNGIGIPGASAKMVTITGGNVFKTSKTGVVTPDYLTWTAMFVNATGTLAYQWAKSTDGSTWTNISGATNSTYNLYPSSLVNNQIYLKCTVTETISGVATSYYDIAIVNMVIDGKDSISILLSNNFQSIPCSSNGTIKASDLTVYYTDIDVYRGADKLTVGTDWNISTATGSLNSSFIFTAGTNRVKLSALTVDTATCTIAIVIAGVTYNAYFRVAKTYDGINGSNGVKVENRYYKNGSRTTYDTAPADVVDPSGWTTAMPSAGFLEYIWMTSTIKTYDGSAFATTTHWSTPVCISPIVGGPAVGGLDWDSTKSDYSGSPIKCSVVKYNGSYYIARADKPTIPAGTLPTNTAYWSSFGASYESIATQFAWIENAIIANFRYYNGAMSSMQLDANGKPNIIINGDNGYSKFSIIDLGSFHLDGNDIYGVDTSGIERIRFKTTALEDITTVNSSSWSIITPSKAERYLAGVFTTNSAGEFVCPSLTVAELTQDFSVPTACTIKINNSIFGYSVKSTSNNYIGDLAYTTKVLLDGVEITNMTQNVAAGSHSVRIVMTATGGTGYMNTSFRVYMTIQNYGISLYNASTSKTVIATNGMYSAMGTNRYLYFSDSYGFELRIDNWGIRILNNGVLQRYDGNRWCGINSCKKYYFTSGSITIDSSAATTGVDYVLYNGSSEGTVYLPSSPEDGRTIKVRKIGSGNVRVYGNGKNIYVNSDNSNILVEYAYCYEFVYDSNVNEWIANRAGY